MAKSTKATTDSQALTTGETFGLPGDLVLTIREPASVTGEVSVQLSPEEVAVLETLLDRDHTAAIVHGGLKGLLSLNDAQTRALLGLCRRIKFR